MRQTKQKIAEYTKSLTGLKEKIVGTLILLVMSTVMLGTVSFAWLTLSRNPEMSGAATSVASNGNLEIALAPANGSEPRPSKVGDSLLSVYEKNTTWGNLINLSIEEYGLDHLTLRPASLNTSELLTSPLYAAEYGEDGRVKALVTSFAFATWQMEKDGVPGHFLKNDDQGVRAIVSTTMKNYTGDKVFYDMTKEITQKNLSAGNKYEQLADNEKYMNTLATMMGLYMTARMNPDDASLSNPTFNPEDIENLIAMYNEFLVAYDLEAEAVATVINLQNYIIENGNATYVYKIQDVYDLYTQKDDGSYDASKLTALQSKVNTYLSANGKSTLDYSELEKFIEDHNTIVADIKKLEVIYSSGNTKWKDSGLNNIVNNLVNVGTCTIDGTQINSIGASNAAGYLSGTHDAIITNGILYNFEKMCGASIEVKGLSITARIKRLGIPVNGTVTANISTNAPKNPYIFKVYADSAKNMKTGTIGAGEEVARDTYGLAVDFYVRTNAENSYLTLEGNIITESKRERAIGKNANGEQVQLYVFYKDVEEVTDEGTTTRTDAFDVYKVVDEDGIEQWYYADSHTLITEDELGDQELNEKWIDVEYVIGYEGENRIWDSESNLNLTVNSTSQGSGSCYVYYADSPEDQARSLNVLASLEVAFVDDKGMVLATAYLDTTRYYANSGKVIVPLVLKSTSIKIGHDQNGDAVYAITALERNVATKITALIYLEGTFLENDDVLASADIQGQLNIQFASSVPLYPLNNEDLSVKKLIVSASLDKTEFDYDDKSQHPMTTNVKVIVDGVKPSSVKAFFIRQINATQGSREMAFDLNRITDSEWTQNYTFSSPGVYILRSVYIDGVEYQLDGVYTVTISGFALESLTWTEGDGKTTLVMSAEPSYKTNVYLKFQSDDTALMPNVVQGRFLRDDGLAVNIDFKKDSGGMWSGIANFVTSGEYKLQYLLLNGEYVEIPENIQKEATVYLGLKVSVYTTSPNNFDYDPVNMTEEQRNLGMRVKILTDNNESLIGIQGAKLYYGLAGSSTTAMDTDLVWNQGENYYLGTMHIPYAGIFKFMKVEANSNVISKAETSPVFTVLSPEPPSYEANNTTQSQITFDNKATFSILLKNASSAIVRPVIINTSDPSIVYGADYYKMLAENNKTASFGEGKLNKFASDELGEYLGYYNYYVTNEDKDGYTEFIFDIPINNGNQEGTWKLIGIDIAQVYDANGQACTTTKPMVVDLSQYAINTSVICKVDLVFDSSSVRELCYGYNGDSITGKFLETYTIDDKTGIRMKFIDSKLETLDLSEYISGDIEIVVEYSGGHQECGGYTMDGTTITSLYTPVTLKLSDHDKDGIYTVNNSNGIKYAGYYFIKSIKYQIKGQNPITMVYESKDIQPSNAPVITVKSKAPEVRISKIKVINEVTGTGKSSGTSNFAVDKIMDGSTTDAKNGCDYIASSNHVKGAYTAYISEDRLYTDVFVACESYSSAGDDHECVPAEVTLTFSGLENFSSYSASLSFVTNRTDKKVHMYESYGGSITNWDPDTSTQTSVFVWSEGSLSCRRYIGSVGGSSSASDSKAAAGKLTSSDSLQVVIDGVTYIFNIPVITINEQY